MLKVSPSEEKGVIIYEFVLSHVTPVENITLPFSLLDDDIDILAPAITL